MAYQSEAALEQQFIDQLNNGKRVIGSASVRLAL